MDDWPMLELDCEDFQKGMVSLLGKPRVII